ncbi:MAG: GyrI-like domain-containing protein [Planctomycetota bacterium]
MIESHRILETEAHPAAVIHLTIPREQMPAEMPTAIHEILAALQAQGVQPTGPLFAHHLNLSSDLFDFEVGFPVGGAIAAAGRVRPGNLPAAKVVQTVYHGPYEGLFSAWQSFGDQAASDLAAGGLKPASNLWERYLTGPESDPDPSTWRTELNLPLIEAAS